MGEEFNIVHNFIENFIKEPIEKTGNYWFVRTDRGHNFNNFTTGGFIGIGWNDISIEDMDDDKIEITKTKIARLERLDQTESRDKSKVTSIYNKLKRFTSLQKGDIIISPSKKAYKIAFGIVKENNCYFENIPTDFCEYQKRIKVEWVSIKPFEQLDSMFYQIKGTRHSISDIKKYAPFIDKEMNTIYIKNNSGHYVVDVRSSDDINTFSLLEFIKQTNYFISLINEEFNFNENIDDSSIKLNVQSPGKIEFKIPGGKTMVMLAFLIPFIGCEDSETNTPRELITPIQKIKSENTEQIEDYKKAMNELNIKYDSIVSFH
ncbi:hypothetical protein [Tenacibaculum piscium]|uniref:hypothetical protein n=1 Tax=Tenacibaculum piscium TaxID=1458515 RepID=UPI00187B5914|nr:hypothetical protein [Tenacibaculum piscium]MBE7691278.1 hypothetical protein [Tenacibaculum piscium]